MRKASATSAVIAGLILVLPMTGAGTTGAQQPQCLNNSGEYTVDAGFQYTDANGTWVCAPNSPSASAGGWVRLEPTPTVVPTATPPTPPAAAAPRERSRGTLSSSAAMMMAVGITVIAAGCGVVLVARRGRRRAFGRLVVRDGPQTRIVNLAGLPSPIRVGTAGEIALHAAGVERRHAELMPRDNGRRAEMTLVPRDGQTAIHRHGRSIATAAPTALCDGDEIDVGAAQLTFRCIGARPTARSRRA